MVIGTHGQILVLAAVLAAIIWNLLTWWLGLPSSSSHALIGGMIGSAFVAGGARVLTLHDPNGLPKVFKALVFSPIAGFIAGAVLMIIVMNIFAQHAPSKLNRHFKILQVVSSASMAFAHGSNDAQKSMGIITMALVVGRFIPTPDVPLWVKLCCGTAMALGTAVGGWRIIKTVGKKMIMGLQPVHGFAAETAGALVILAATKYGAPVSTTHVISSSIMGVGSSRSLSTVRWGTVGQILIAWLMTLPISAILGAGCYALLHFLLVRGV
jgi:PiT family inorganic phosphate transporter